MGVVELLTLQPLGVPRVVEHGLCARCGRPTVRPAARALLERLRSTAQPFSLERLDHPLSARPRDPPGSARAVRAEQRMSGIHQVAADVKVGGRPGRATEISTPVTSDRPTSAAASAASGTPSTLSWSVSANSSTPACLAALTISAGRQFAVGMGRVALELERAARNRSGLSSERRLSWMVGGRSPVRSSKQGVVRAP